MFYLMLHSTHFFYSNMIKDQSDSVRGNLLPPLHELVFPISSMKYFICIIPQTGEHIPHPLIIQMESIGWNEKKLNGSTIRDRSDDSSHHEWSLYHGS